MDVVMPAHPKDAETARASIRAVLRHVADVGVVHVVSGEDLGVRDARVRWVPEAEIAGVPPVDAIRGRWPAGSPASERAGWIFQQLVKLAAPSCIPGLSARYLVVDADVIFLRSVSFAGPRFPYSRATELHPPYHESYRRLLGEAPRSDASFTAHHMVFDQELLAELLGSIEARHGKPWVEALLDSVDPGERSSISEWELYGHWVRARHPTLAEHRQLSWLDIRFVPGLWGRAVLSLDYDFVAPHAYLREPRSVRNRSALSRVRDEIRAAIR